MEKRSKTRDLDIRTLRHPSVYYMLSALLENSKVSENGPWCPRYNILYNMKRNMQKQNRILKEFLFYWVTESYRSSIHLSKLQPWVQNAGLKIPDLTLTRHATMGHLFRLPLLLRARAINSHHLRASWYRLNWIIHLKFLKVSLANIYL